MLSSLTGMLPEIGAWLQPAIHGVNAMIKGTTGREICLAFMKFFLGECTEAK